MQRELNRATLARQLLLGRARLPVVRGVERLAGLQAQLAAAPYVGLWSRLGGFRPESLDRALRTRTVARGVLMRGTVHLVSAPDFGLLARPRFGAVLAPALREYCAEPRTRE